MQNLKQKQSESIDKSSHISCAQKIFSGGRLRGGGGGGGGGGEQQRSSHISCAQKIFSERGIEGGGGNSSNPVISHVSRKFSGRFSRLLV